MSDDATAGRSAADDDAGPDDAKREGASTPAVAAGTAALGPFRFECGRTLPLEVAYETYGDPSDPAVLVCHALTGSQRVVATGERDEATGWWDDLVGPGKPVDTTEHYVVCANVPGSCYGTTGPASTAPGGGRYGRDFPAVTVGDWTRSQARLLDHLGVDRLHAVVGGSVGGMNALDWARRYPERVDRVVAVATGARLDPQLVGLSTVARRAVTADPAYGTGDATGGLAVARRLGHVLYRSKESLQDAFGRDAPAPDDPHPDQPVASYLDHNAERFVERFDPVSYCRLRRAMESFDLARGFEGDGDALDEFDGEALVVSFTGDWHFPTGDGERLAAAFREADVPVSHHVVESAYGHDAFLVQVDRYAGVLRSVLGTERARPSFAPVHASHLQG
jgi:homoserine O-acetyltransferase